jgi:hypothetical protein
VDATFDVARERLVAGALRETRLSTLVRLEEMPRLPRLDSDSCLDCVGDVTGVDSESLGRLRPYEDGATEELDSPDGRWTFYKIMGELKCDSKTKSTALTATLWENCKLRSLRVFLVLGEAMIILRLCFALPFGFSAVRSFIFALPKDR